MKVEVLIAQLCLTLCVPMDCTPPGFSVQGILQVRILECVAIHFPKEFLDPGIEPRFPALQNDSLPSCSQPLPIYLFIVVIV